MGTRSLTHIFQDDKEILCLYRQFDGYPSGHGVELAEFIKSGEFVNGIPMGTNKKMFNGAGCFAAQLVGHLKRGEAGGVYIKAPGSTDCDEEYVYTIRCGLDASHKVSDVKIEVTSVYEGRKEFEGGVDAFETFCNTPDNDD